MDTVEFLEGKSFYVIKYKLPEECIYKRKASKKTFSEFSNMCIPKVDQATSKDIKFPSLTVGSTAQVDSSANLLMLQIRDAETRRKLLQVWLRDLIKRGRDHMFEDPATKNVLLSFLFDLVSNETSSRH